MSDELLVQYASPTLAGIKTGNIFNCKFDLKEKLIAYIHHINKCLVPKGICVILLRLRTHSALIYMYRPAKLKQDLDTAEAQELLKAAGYKNTKVSGCLTELIGRLACEGNFPHEIGLFLGYPPEDVRGFIEGRKDYKCIGCWKVYGDECRAKETFARFRRCREIYRRQYENGRSIDSLAVSTGL